MDSSVNMNINLNLEDLLTLDFFERDHAIREEREKEKNKVKKEYGCENSELLDFDPRNEHIEKSEYKGKICYIKVKNN